jgi:lysozyme
MLQAEVERFDKKLTEVIRYPLNQNQWDALVSFSYNVKWDQFLRSKLLAELNRGNFPAALSHWRAWHHATVWDKARQAYVKKPLAGLIRRRNAEVELFKRPMPGKILSSPYTGSDEALEKLEDRPRALQLLAIVNWFRKQLRG